MSRRRHRYRYKRTPAEHLLIDFIKSASQIPWWLTVPVAAMLLYLVPYALPATPQLTEPADAIGLVFSIFIKTFLKYVVPIALMFAALLNILNRSKSAILFKRIDTKGAHNTLLELNWKDFEFLLTEWYKKQGYKTELTGGGGADGGVDIKLHKDGELYLVQCKHYKAWKVSVSVVRELFGVVAANNAAGGFLVTSGKFTKDAIEFANGKNIELVDGAELALILDEVKQPVSQPKTVRCPRCGGVLVERSGKYGQFTGCSNYPECKFTK